VHIWPLRLEKRLLLLCFAGILIDYKSEELFPSLAFYTSAIAAGFVAGFVAVGGLALPTNQALLLLLLFLLVLLLRRRTTSVNLCKLVLT
jgi:hypothetical protein